MEKTNVMRLLDAAKIPYGSYEYAAPDGALSGVEVMGRDVSVVSTHPASLNPSIRSIVGSDLGIGAHMETIRYSLKPHKVFLFDRETEARVPFEVM